MAVMTAELTGVRGTDEKDITILTSELLAAKLKAAGANVITTRETDTYVSLRKRVAISNQHAADAFIILHTMLIPILA